MWCFIDEDTYAIRESLDLSDYVLRLTIGFQILFDRENKAPQTAEDYGNLMARFIVDQAVKEAIQRGETSLEYTEVISLAVIAHLNSKHPTYSSRYDSLVRAIVSSTCG